MMNVVRNNLANNYVRSILFAFLPVALILFSYFAVSKSFAAPVEEEQQAKHNSIVEDRWNPGWMRRGMWGPGRMGPVQSQRMARHWAFMHSNIPDEYRRQVNPIRSDKVALKEGAKLYAENCARCHGANGMGDGDLGNDLSPSPALLAYMIQMPMSVDEYMLWSISEGGDQFGTNMPAFKDKLSKDEIWKIVTFMRAGFPSESGLKKD